MVLVYSNDAPACRSVCLSQHLIWFLVMFFVFYEKWNRRCLQSSTFSPSAAERQRRALAYLGDYDEMKNKRDRDTYEDALEVGLAS